MSSSSNTTTTSSSTSSSNDNRGGKYSKKYLDEMEKYACRNLNELIESQTHLTPATIKIIKDKVSASAANVFATLKSEWEPRYNQNKIIEPLDTDLALEVGKLEADVMKLKAQVATARTEVPTAVASFYRDRLESVTASAISSTTASEEDEGAAIVEKENQQAELHKIGAQSEFIKQAVRNAKCSLDTVQANVPNAITEYKDLVETITGAMDKPKSHLDQVLQETSNKQ